MHDVIKPAMDYQPTKLATQKVVDVLSRGNVLNMALVSPKLLSLLLRYMISQAVLLLLANFALSVKILYVFLMPT